MIYPEADAPLAHALARWSGTGSATGSARHTLTLARPWRVPSDTQVIEACYRFRHAPWGHSLTADVAGTTVDLDAPVELVTVAIPKPWGREIWYTGIEARGESAIRTEQGALPLSTYLALAPRHLVRRQPLVLLKILDPRPQPIAGDLYFEVHREKQEVYVVTHVDPAAWPDGLGAIRFGMNQALRGRYANDAAFRQDYLRAVADYEALRRRIDAGETIAPELEQAARGEMERFTALRRLAVGDVVAVPAWMPHALQHGVRVIEFQTPTYERYIISFAQRVQTQDRWDSAVAIPRMALDAPAEPRFEHVADGVEQIVRFDDFRVWRVTLGAGAAFELPGHPPYALCLTVQGTLALGGLALGPERAALVPGATLADPARRRALASIHNPGTAPAVFLIAAPDL